MAAAPAGFGGRPAVGFSEHGIEAAQAGKAGVQRELRHREVGGVDEALGGIAGSFSLSALGGGEGRGEVGGAPHSELAARPTSPSRALMRPGPSLSPSRAERGLGQAAVRF